MYCPQCRSEYRTGITTCATCGVPLVDTLPELETLEASETTKPIGVTNLHGVGRTVEVAGKVIDLMRVFTYDEAVDLKTALNDGGIPAAMKQLTGVKFPDKVTRFEVHVKGEDHDRAEAFLVDRWQRQASEDVEADASLPEDAESCPACGAKVPLDVAECPECGLNVGVGEGEGEDEVTEDKEP